MFRRVLFAAIATAVMVGCSDMITEQAEKNTNADIPVNISYANAALSEKTHDAKAIIENEKGDRQEFDLEIKDDGIVGVIEDVKDDEHVKVCVEVYDSAGDLEWKGTDIVEKNDEDTYESVNTDLYKIDENGEIKIDEKIEDFNCSEEEISTADLETYMEFLIDFAGIDEAFQKELKQLVAGREWTKDELILLEYFLILLQDAHVEKKEYVEWDTDTVFIDNDFCGTDTIYDDSVYSGEFLPVEVIYEIIEVTAYEFGVSAEELAGLVERETKLFVEPVPVSAEEEVFLQIEKLALILADKSDGTKDSSDVDTGAYFTDGAILEITTMIAYEYGVSVEALIELVKYETKLLVEPVPVSAEEEVFLQIEKLALILSEKTDGTKDSSDVVDSDSVVYFSDEAILEIVEMTAKEFGVNVEELIGFVKRETKLFLEPVPVTAEEEVYYQIEKLALILLDKSVDTAVEEIDTIEIADSTVIYDEGKETSDGVKEESDTLSKELVK